VGSSHYHKIFIQRTFVDSMIDTAAGINATGYKVAGSMMIACRPVSLRTSSTMFCVPPPGPMPHLAQAGYRLGPA
jgi:hypothetical protein